MALAYGRLVVATATQCLIYSERSWTVPCIVDLKSPAVLIVQAANLFLVVDQQAGLQLFTYEGRSVSSPKLPNAQPDLFSLQTVALSDDTLALRDHRDDKLVRIIDVQSGKELGKPVQHVIGVQHLSLEQTPNAAFSRHLALIDKNR